MDIHAAKRRYVQKWLRKYFSIGNNNKEVSLKAFENFNIFWSGAFGKLKNWNVKCLSKLLHRWRLQLQRSSLWHIRACDNSDNVNFCLHQILQNACCKF